MTAAQEPPWGTAVPTNEVRQAWIDEQLAAKAEPAIVEEQRARPVSVVSAPSSDVRQAMALLRAARRVNELHNEMNDAEERFKKAKAEFEAVGSAYHQARSDLRQIEEGS